MILYVPLIYLQLSGVGFEKTWAVKDWTQLGREDLLEWHPGQRCKAQIPQEQRITPHEWSKLFSNCLAVSCKKNTNVSNISINTRSLPRWLIPAPLAPWIKGHNHTTENLPLKGSTNFHYLLCTICQTFSRPQDPKIIKLKGALLLRGSFALGLWKVLEIMDTIHEWLMWGCSSSQIVTPLCTCIFVETSP